MEKNNNFGLIKNNGAEATLQYLISLLLSYLEELKDSKSTDSDLFCYGERVAYTECLEIIQDWEKAKDCGLHFEIESKYSL